MAGDVAAAHLGGGAELGPSAVISPPFPAAATVLIRGLPPIANENNIRDLFGREWITLGRVTVCQNNAGKCKGYAFADIASLEQVHRAVQSLNGIDAGGIRVSVDVFKVMMMPAGANDEGAPGGPPMSYSPHGAAACFSPAVPAAGSPASAGEGVTLFLGGLSFRAEEKDIRELFARHRILIEKVSVAVDRDTSKHKGYAFVELKDPSQAVMARRVLNGVELCGRPFTLEIKGGERSRQAANPAAPVGGVPKAPDVDKEAFRLFVGGLSQQAPGFFFQATEDIVKSKFSEVAPVVDVRVVADKDTGRPKGFAFVEFQHAKDVEKAIRKLQGVEICGKAVRLAPPGAGRGAATPAAAQGPAARGPGRPEGSLKAPFKGLSADRKKEMFGDAEASRSRSRKRRRSRSHRRRRRRSVSTSSSKSKKKSKKG